MRIPAHSILSVLERRASVHPVTFSLQRDACSFDISAFEGAMCIGYVVVQRSISGAYVLENKPESEYVHEGFLNGVGWGIEVLPSYRDRNLGHALLSVGISLAFHECSAIDRFCVKAKGLGTNERFYSSFGFDIQHSQKGEYVYKVGTYTKHSVPDILLD